MARQGGRTVVSVRISICFTELNFIVVLVQSNADIRQFWGCLELQALVYDILPSFGGKCRKAMLGVSLGLSVPVAFG